ncbi:hypothetical protein GYMLUDRAFT_72306 [Collybiopsis luxurians FD-317 M1]|uniref:NADP-dependent oxidoreductase domain-containing protein n=1 Tax=Collybiopsis luxurians FD-317 M1 TaxID=944289 RepID=A0A0D0BGP5_9AGAR|nr:hypothetical protein GYMLUDRAFT_72306 [Collybiopsis luxurians FD-317 M1]
MDDVLIAALDPSVLRAVIRTFVSQGAFAHTTLLNHVQNWLKTSPPRFIPHRELFNTTSPSYPQFLADVRCMFTGQMPAESLPYLSHFLVSVTQAGLLWSPDDEHEAILTRFCGDVVQAMQALKECCPSPTDELKDRLLGLQKALIACETYSSDKGLTSPWWGALLQVEDALVWFFPDAIPFRGTSERQVSSQALDGTKLPTDMEAVEVIEHVSLGSLEVPRLFNGLWQLSSPAWGFAPNNKQNAALEQLVKAGLLATDMADHYGDAELVYKSFRTRLPLSVASTVVAATKWCIFRDPEGDISAQFVLNAVQERSRRLGGRIELLQFHWFDYSRKDYLFILTELVKLSKSHPELVSNVGLCNFDAEHTEEACLHILSEFGQVGLVSNQVQYSLVDPRPSIKMTDVCNKYGLKLLTYGTLCGGLMSEKWLGAKEPNIYSESLRLTPSHRKYFDVIKAWASWNDFQILLSTLKAIADKHRVDLANVATRWVLDRPAVGAVIVGTRLGVSSNVESNLKTFSLRLDEEDTNTLNELALTRADKVYRIMGDCGSEYRKSSKQEL